MENTIEVLEEIHRLETKLNKKKEELKEIQKKCIHDWRREIDSGPYPEKWYRCSKCCMIK